MRRITSIKNAISYFAENSIERTSKTISGEEYTSIVPPTGFHHMNLSIKTNGMVITHEYQSWQWKDYVAIIQKNIMNITKLVVYYE